jgi:hypothetical protein
VAEFTIKRGSRLPRIRATVPGAQEGGPVDLSGVTAVQFVMADMKGVLKVNAAGAVLDAAERIVEYAWAAADTEVAGEYEAEFMLTFTGGEQMRVPTDGYIIVRVVPDKG